MTCQRIGSLPISTSGFGMVAVCSWSRVPRPPQRMSTVSRPSSATGRASCQSPWRVPATTFDATMSALPASIFKAYDVRGIYGDDIDEEAAEQLGRAFVRVLAKLEEKDAADLRVRLGRDMRLQAPELAERSRDGMASEGAHVLDAGRVGTEMLYHLVGSQDLDGGRVCTGSPHTQRAARRG